MTEEGWESAVRDESVSAHSLPDQSIDAHELLCVGLVYVFCFVLPAFAIGVLDVT